MTWAEFCIRLNGYKRLDKKEWYKIRFLGYQTYISNWMDSKKKPVSIDKYLPLDNSKKQGLNEQQKAALLKAHEDYNNRKSKS